MWAEEGSGSFGGEHARARATYEPDDDQNRVSLLFAQKELHLTEAAGSKIILCWKFCDSHPVPLVDVPSGIPTAFRMEFLIVSNLRVDIIFGRGESADGPNQTVNPFQQSHRLEGAKQPSGGRVVASYTWPFRNLSKSPTTLSDRPRKSAGTTASVSPSPSEPNQQTQQPQQLIPFVPVAEARLEREEVAGLEDWEHVPPWSDDSSDPSSAKNIIKDKLQPKGDKGCSQAPAENVKDKLLQKARQVDSKAERRGDPYIVDTPPVPSSEHGQHNNNGAVLSESSEDRSSDGLGHNYTDSSSVSQLAESNTLELASQRREECLSTTATDGMNHQFTRSPTLERYMELYQLPEMNIHKAEALRRKIGHAELLAPGSSDDSEHAKAARLQWTLDPHKKRYYRINPENQERDYYYSDSE